MRKATQLASLKAQWLQTSHQTVDRVLWNPELLKYTKIPNLGGEGWCWWWWWGAHISTQCHPLSVQLNCYRTSNRTIEVRFSEWGEICCECRTDWCWPKLFSRYLGVPPRRLIGRVVKLTTTLHTLTTLRISGVNLHASRLHSGWSQRQRQAYLVCTPKVCASDDRTLPEDDSKHVIILRTPASTLSRNNAVPALN
jgi:hypothetical protein